MVSDGKEKKQITVREEDIRVEGQTSGEWVHLGEFELEAGKEAYVEISNQGADGVTVADAVLWVPDNQKGPDGYQERHGHLSSTLNLR